MLLGFGAFGLELLLSDDESNAKLEAPKKSSLENEDHSILNEICYLTIERSKQKSCSKKVKTIGNTPCTVIR